MIDGSAVVLSAWKYLEVGALAQVAVVVAAWEEDYEGV